MSDFLFAWELGGGLGHSMPLSQVARPLLECGHRVHLCLRDLSTARAALGPLADHPAVRFWQAPVWLPNLGGVPESVSYAELLFRAGYLDAGRLAVLARAWRSLFEATGARVLLADHAPTALLAARGTPLRTAIMGTGFFLPPQLEPMPSFRTWEQVPDERLRRSEAKALEVANGVLDGLVAPRLTRLCELVRADEQLLFTWPELDHYAAREPDASRRYLGPLPDARQGAEPAWPQGDEPPVFGYLKGDYPGLEVLLASLREAPLRTLAYVPGLPPPLRAKLASRRLAFSEKPVHMGAVCAAAGAVLCNAGSGTVCTALRAGVPVVMLPMHAEQMLFSLRVQAAGAGVTLAGNEARAGLRPALERVLRDRSFAAAAAGLAERHAPGDGPDAAVEAADRLEALAARAG